MIGLTRPLTVGFFRTISNNWLDISSYSVDMDAFVKVKKQKNIDIFGREVVSKTIRNIIDNNETLCIYGQIGVGKTFIIKQLLKGEIYVDFDYKTNLELLEMSNCHVIIDNIDTEGLLWKQISEKKKLSKGSTIIITNSIKNVDFCDCIHIEPLSNKLQIELVSKEYPSVVNHEFVLSCIHRARGNLRDLLLYVQNSDDKDIFMSPKDYVHKLLTEKGSYSIGENVEDHGFSWGVVHENYIDAKNINHESIIHDLSLADVYDSKIYGGDWNLLPYFCHHGVIKPCIEIGGALNKECIRPGSSWTKFNNHKMRLSKMTGIKNRSKSGIGVDEMCLLRDICLQDQDKAVEIMVSYGMLPQDIDVMNHITLLKKIKPKAVQSLKKKLKNVLES